MTTHTYFNFDSIDRARLASTLGIIDDLRMLMENRAGMSAEDGEVIDNEELSATYDVLYRILTNDTWYLADQDEK